MSDVVNAVKFLQEFTFTRHTDQLRVTALLHSSNCIGYLTNLPVDSNAEKPVQYFLEAFRDGNAQSELVWNMRYLAKFTDERGMYVDGLVDPDKWLVVKSHVTAYVVCTGMFHVCRDIDTVYLPTANTDYSYNGVVLP